MSIQSDAYQLCKAVWNSSSRDRVGNLIRNLSSVLQKDSGTVADRSQFGYIARQQHAQLLGYLMVDQERARLAKGPFPVILPPLPPEERQLLTGAHKQIVRLNKECVAPLTTKIPKCTNAIDPYSGFHYVSDLETTGIEILTQDAIEKMAKSFHNHPAIGLALTTGVISDGLAENQYIELLCRFTDLLHQAGVFKSPDDFSQIVYTQARETPTRIVARHLVALTCLRASLATLDQLVYQAILSNRLPILDENNIIGIEKSNQHLAGSGLSIVFQSSEQAGIDMEPLSLALVKCVPPGMSTTQLFRTEEVHLEFSKDLGETIQVSLRKVDENMNPFGPLLEHM